MSIKGCGGTNSRFTYLYNVKIITLDLSKISVNCNGISK